MTVDAILYVEDNRILARTVEDVLEMLDGTSSIARIAAWPAL
jgi:hypothetical protein